VRIILSLSSRIRYRAPRLHEWKFPDTHRNVEISTGRRRMVLFHTLISLIGIVTGLVVMYGLLGAKRMPGMTAVFLVTTILTSATGYLIPPLFFDKLLPSHVVGSSRWCCSRSPASRSMP
jgi:hypothetical protein